MSFPDLDWRALKRELDKNPSGEFSSEWFWDRSFTIQQLVLCVTMAEDIDVIEAIDEVEQMVHRLGVISYCDHGVVHLVRREWIIHRSGPPLPSYMKRWDVRAEVVNIENGDRCIHCGADYLAGRWV